MASVSDLVKQVKELVEGTEKDVEKCEKGNRQAGVRVRKNMKSVIDLSKEVRNAVLDLRN